MTMRLAPLFAMPMTPVISTASKFALGVPFGSQPITSLVSEPLTHNANEARFIPFVIPSRYNVQKLWYYDGAVGSGNIDMGIYDQFGNRLVSKGSTAKGTTSAIVEFDVTDTEVGPGLIYLAIAMSVAADEVISWEQVTNLGYHAGLGVSFMASAFPLPATATLTLLADSFNYFMPFMGMSNRTLVA